jgi:hypothetical protein
MTFIIHTRSWDVWRQRPDLAGHIAAISQIWALVEYELALMFVILSGSNLALGRVFFDIVGLPPRLQMLHSLINTYMRDKADKQRYDDLQQRLRKAGSLRNSIVHGLWDIRDDRPKTIFLTHPYPLTTAEATSVPYTKRRFTDTAKSFGLLYRDIVAFRSHLSTLAQAEPFPRTFLLRK